MPEMRCNDPAIRLFGQKIPLPAGSGSPAADDDKDSPTREVTEATQDDDSLPPYQTTPDCNENPKTPPIDEDSSKSRSSKAENEQSDAANSQEKPHKKPDKILPCPRCNSTDTKFCYYNNYNVSQPRHFCKSCQRYWTAGGTMRNVPVGAGRRKNKNPASHYRHITISEALQAAHIDAPDRTSHPALNANGRVLNFGLEPPVCDPVAASILNLPDTKTLNGAQNGFQRIKVAENVDDRSSLVTCHSSLEEGLNHPRERLARGINGFALPITCLPGVPWPYPTAFCPPVYPMPFFPPAAYWNCGMPGGWNIPMLSPQSSTSSNQKEQCPNPNSSKLGKHSRDNDELNPVELEKGAAPKHKNGCVLVPKILRIDDPDEAAKSSIWTTLGIKNESFSRERFFKAIQPKGDEKNRPAEASCAMRANPAALSRSIGFHESS